MEYNNRTFNLGNISSRISRIRFTHNTRYAQSANHSSNTISRSVPHFEHGSSQFADFLIRLILCITIFSGLMLMKNSTNSTVSVIYDYVSNWTKANYSIPEEYGLDKFVSAIKNSTSTSIFSESDYPSISLPAGCTVNTAYGDTFNDTVCMGVIFESDTQGNVLASINGTVTHIDSDEIMGNYIVIENESLTKVIIGCCSEIIVSEGDVVDTNTVVSQFLQGAHNKYYFYLEVHQNGIVIDPEKCFKGTV